MKKLLLATIFLFSTQIMAQGFGGGGFPGGGKPFPPPNNGGHNGHKPGHGDGEGHFGDTFGGQIRKVINFNGQELKGQTVIKLRQALKQNFPDLDLDQYTLVTASVLGQSFKGDGIATLVIGAEESLDKTISGSPKKWNSGKAEDYVRVHFDSPVSAEEQFKNKMPWQIKLDGNFIIQNVEVHLAATKWKNPKDPGNPFDDVIGVIKK